MSIETRYMVQCQPCERWLAPETINSAAVVDSCASPLFLTFSSAYDEAVRRGWSAYPLTCPDCAADQKKEGSDEEIRGDIPPAENSGRLPESGESPQ